MAGQSMLEITTFPTVTPTDPHELAFQSWCKELLKSKIFKGYYLERRYVEDIKDYRDVVCLQKSEKSLEKILRDLSYKLKFFYNIQNPNKWIGITSGPITGANPPADALETCLWVELKELAFIEYWFSIKTIRFRDNEIIIKLNVLRPVEPEDTSKRTPSSEATSDNITTDSSNTNPETVPTFHDFVLLLQSWRISIKQTVYNFMAEDINKENIKSELRFVALLMVAVFSASMAGLKLFGYFMLRLIFETNRLVHTFTPIILKLIDVFSKIVAGFFVLLSMIWKDTAGNRNNRNKAIEYNPNMYNSIQYEGRQRRFGSSPTNYKNSFQ